jgi:hypothetical protein
MRRAHVQLLHFIGRPIPLPRRDVRSGSKADLTAPKSYFRFTLESGLNSDIAPCPKSAISGLMHRSKQHLYSITSSASASKDGGTAMARVFAVLRLMTISNLVGWMIGKSAGLSPSRMRPA